jgi:hypothetical protein
MLTLDANRFLEVMEFLVRNHQANEKSTGDLSKLALRNFKAGIKETIVRLERLDLPVSVAAACHLLGEIKSYPQLHRGVEQITNTVRFELEGRKFYRPVRQFEKFYDHPKLFGDGVFTAFPSANNDISEAGTCLALERGTACVMHLMRIVETGLAALAKATGASKQNDWGSYLREIDAKLVAATKVAGARSPLEQFYAEAALTIDGVRRAWRNPTMHIENSYSVERAEEILIAVRSLMRHLATQLSE